MIKSLEQDGSKSLELPKLKNLQTAFRTYYDTYEVTQDANKAEFMMETIAKSFQIDSLDTHIQDLLPFLEKYTGIYKEHLELDSRTTQLANLVQKKVDITERKEQLA